MVKVGVKQAYSMTSTCREVLLDKSEVHIN
jgi:hypothetical protein